MSYSSEAEPEHTLQQVAWPALPHPIHHESLDFEGRKPAGAQPSDQAHYNAGAVTPWLGLRSRLSQVPINRWTVLLLLVLARLLISLDSLNTNLISAKSRAESACTKVEEVGSSMASMPHYLSTGVNCMAANGVTEAVQGLVEILLMILTGVQQLIMFFIEIKVGLILCFSTAIAQAVLEVGEFAIKGATEYLNEAIKGIAGGLESALKDLSRVLDGLRDAANLVGATIPNTDALDDGLEKLENVSINADSILGDLKDIENKISYDHVKNIAKEAIAVPFDMVKRLLNESYGSWEFDPSVFPVPAVETLSVCSNSELEGFFELLFTIAANAKIIAIVALIGLAVLACAVMAWWEFKRFNRQLHKSEVLLEREPMDIAYVAGRPFTAGTGLWISETLTRNREHEPMDIVDVAGRPVAADTGVRLPEKVPGNRKREQFLIRWVIAYATTYPALFVLALAVAGALSCLSQWIILRAIQQEVPAFAATVGVFAGNVATLMEQASTHWANDSNNVILKFEGELNDKMFGHVRNATYAANDTIGKFDDSMREALNTAFGAVPPLEKFLSDIIDCLIGNQLDAVQEGLTWVNEKAHVTLPLFPEDVFSVGVNDAANGNFSAMSFPSTPSSSVTDQIMVAVNSVVVTLWTSIIQEMVISIVLFLIYLAYVFFAVAQAAVRVAMGDREHDNGGRERRQSCVGDGYDSGDADSRLSGLGDREPVRGTPVRAWTEPRDEVSFVERIPQEE